MQMKQIPFYFTMLALLLIWSCDNKQQSASINNRIVGKWRMVEYASGCVKALDTLSFIRITRLTAHLKRVKLPTA